MTSCGYMDSVEARVSYLFSCLQSSADQEDVVRAVAGLFHHMRTMHLDSPQDFDAAYSATWKFYQGRSTITRSKSGQVSLRHGLTKIH